VKYPLASPWKTRFPAVEIGEPFSSSGRVAIQRGRALYRDYCLVCHGETGTGNGVAAAGLAKKPKNLASMKRPPIFPDGVVAYRIANGGEVMPAWKGILTEAQIWDLLNYIRSLSTSGSDGRG